jgi:hypothetical protein
MAAAAGGAATTEAAAAAGTCPGRPPNWRHFLSVTASTCHKRLDSLPAAAWPPSFNVTTAANVFRPRIMCGRSPSPPPRAFFVPLSFSFSLSVSFHLGVVKAFVSLRKNWRSLSLTIVFSREEKPHEPKVDRDAHLLPQA